MFENRICEEQRGPSTELIKAQRDSSIKHKKIHEPQCRRGYDTAGMLMHGHRFNRE